MTLERWTIGGATVTAVVEAETFGIPAVLFLPDADEAGIQAEAEWLVPTYAGADGTIGMRVQAFVIEVGGRCVLVDPCVGNGKVRALPFWNGLDLPWLAALDEAGIAPVQVDTVVHTHLHADHVGWDTHLVDGEWVPTFPQARHLYVAAELEWAKAEPRSAAEDVWADTISPILDAGLADVVAADADLGDGLTLLPTPGHTPGHVSLRIESDGAVGYVSGDLLHHPVQCARPEWAEIADGDVELARATRRSFLARMADEGVLVLGTHFPGRPAGHVVAHGTAYRFEPA